MKIPSFVVSAVCTLSLALPVQATSIVIPPTQEQADVQEQSSQESETRPYERVGNFIYAFHRVIGSTENLNAISLSSSAPVDLAMRARDLAQKFDALSRTMDTATDAEMVETLREATAVKALIEDWQRTR